jgi:hypothetical protein
MLAALLLGSMAAAALWGVWVAVLGAAVVLFVVGFLLAVS